MFLAGIILTVLGTAGVFTAVGLELKLHEPKYHIIMKICPWAIGLGFALIGLGAL